MKFYIYAREDYCELDISPEGLQSGNIKFNPAESEKVLLRIDDPDISPDDFKVGGKFIHYVSEIGNTVAGRLEINPDTMRIIKSQRPSQFISCDENGKQFFFAFTVDNITVLENMDDDEALLYYEVN